VKSEKSKCFIVIEFLSVESYAEMQLILCKDKKIIWKTNEMRTKIIGTIGSCMDFDACESKNGAIFVHISQF
jgi:hypothetical protein